METEIAYRDISLEWVLMSEEKDLNGSQEICGIKDKPCEFGVECTIMMQERKEEEERRENSTYGRNREGGREEICPTHS